MQLRTSGQAFDPPIQSDGSTNTLTIQISDLCTFGNVADVSPVDAVQLVLGGIRPVGGAVIPGTVALNSKGTAITAIFTSAPPAGEYDLPLVLFRNI